MELSEDNIDSLNEIVNIGVGRAAASLSELIGERINLRIPRVRVIESDDESLKNNSGMSVVQGFSGDVSGNASLVFPVDSGQKLAGLLGGYDEGEEIAEFELAGILSEVGNIVLNGVLGSLANAIETDLAYQVPEFFLKESVLAVSETSDSDHQNLGTVLIADTEFSVDAADIYGSVMIAFRIGSLESLLARLEVMYQ